MSSKPDKRFGLSFSLGLSLWYALFLLVAALLLFFTTSFLLKDDIRQKEHEVIDARVKEYGAWYEAGGIEGIRDCVDEERKNSRDIFFVRVADAQNQSLFTSIPKGFEGQHPSRLEKDQPPHSGTWLLVLGEDEKTFWALSSTALPGGLTLQVGMSDVEGQAVLGALRSSFFLVILPVLLLGIIGGGILTFQAMHPVRQITATVRDILREGPGNRRVSARKGRGEMNDLVGLFNQMLDKHQTLIRAMHESLDNVAHDLRTPLTRLRSSSEYALGKAATIEDYRRALEDCAEEAERVTTMLNVLMDVAEAEAGSLKICVAPVHLAEAVQIVIDMYDIVSEEKSICLVNLVDPDLVAPVDRTRILQALANLVDNALKYSGPNTTVTLASRVEGKTAVVTVTDGGMGIAPDELPKIWNRLYRGDRSRSRQGLGLGLSLVRAIVRAHGGAVDVESEIDKGSVFTVRLPL
jgi:signal transduction histidine kinase